MIDVVTTSNAHLFQGQLRQMFEHRYEIFVKRRGWSQLATQDGQEKDQFDTASAVYLLSIRDDGSVDGGLRLIPTTVPHLLSEVFPHAVAGEVPRGPSIHEMTRYFTLRDHAERRRMRWVRGELLCAMFEYCLSQGGEWITTMLDSFYVHRMRQNGWGEELIGPPTRYDEGVAVVAKIAVNDKNLNATRLAHGIFWPALRRPAEMPKAA
jgi:acyl-homoserine lactone synthase